MKQIVTSCVLFILRWSAKTRLSRSRAKVVGVTGSVGKSSFLYLLDRALSKHVKVKTTWQGNSQTGIPLEILDLRSAVSGYHWWQWLHVLLRAPFRAFRPLAVDVVLIEMGIDSPFPPNNMSYLLKLVVPDIGVFLEVSPCHTQQFAAVIPPDKQTDPQAYVQAIAAEKGKIVTHLPKSATAVINRDTTAITQLVPKIQASIVSFGTQSKNTVQYTGWEVTKQATMYTFRIDNKGYRYTTHTVLSQEYGMTIAAVVAVCTLFSVPPDKVFASFGDIIPMPKGRLGVFVGKKETTLIDSSYNASPKSMAGALGLLARLAPKAQRLAVVGDMRELGPLSQREHEVLARKLAQTCDRIVLVGEQMREYALPVLLKMQFPRRYLACFATSKGVGEYVEKILHKGDVVLVKGSQNTIFLEEVMAYLLADREDTQKLCRQSVYWQNVRADFFRSHPNVRVV